MRTIPRTGKPSNVIGLDNETMLDTSNIRDANYYASRQNLCIKTTKNLLTIY